METPAQEVRRWVRQVGDGRPPVAVGAVGVWSSPLRYGDRSAALDAAAELEELGFGALWVPGGIGGDVLGDLAALLGATRRVAVASGILNVWMHEPRQVAADHARVAAAHPGRLLLGIGVSHAPLVESRTDQRYARPLAVVERYLDELDAASPPVPAAERVLAALGPRMLDLARRRTLGAHPYLAPPERTRAAREVLGDGPLLAPEQAVVLETDAAAARERARRHLAVYLGLPNYTRNWLRAGFEPDDLADGGSDRLVDGLVAWGDEEAVADRVREHHDAGADHVCVQVIGADPRQVPLADWRRLAPALVG